MTLYNCKSIPGLPAWRITKFDSALNVEASYEVTSGEPMLCTCPAWPRKQTCKHINMVWKFTGRDYVDTDWYFNADTKGWHQPLGRYSMDIGSTPFPSTSAEDIPLANFMLGDYAKDVKMIPSGSELPPRTEPEAAKGARPPSPSAVSPITRRQIKD